MVHEAIEIKTRWPTMNKDQGFESRWPILVGGIAPPPLHIRWAVSSQLEKHRQENDPLHPLYAQIETQLPPLDGSAALEDWPAISRQYHKNSHSVPRNRYLQVRVRHGPPGQADRDWMMQIPYAEMGIQRGWTDNVRMWGWTDNETPASLPHPATAMYPWRHGRVQPPSQILHPALGGSRVVTREEWIRPDHDLQRITTVHKWSC